MANSASRAGGVPRLHGFAGFRTSHGIQRVELISDAVLGALVPAELVAAHRARGLSPDNPALRGSSQNPDLCFQAHEAVNPFQNALPEHVQSAMASFRSVTGRRYLLFDYYGYSEPEGVIVALVIGGNICSITV